MTINSQAKRDEAIEFLQEYLNPGDTIYTIVRHVARSGMKRWIDCYVIRDNEPQWLTYWAGKATGRNVNNRHPGVECGGCGMDMGFDLVYAIGRAIWGDGFECIGERCPSNDHSNGDRDYTPHHHNSGGYALRQRWM